MRQVIANWQKVVLLAHCTPQPPIFAKKGPHLAPGVGQGGEGAAFTGVASTISLLMAALSRSLATECDGHHAL